MLSAKEIAEIYSVTPSTVSNWVKDGAPVAGQQRDRASRLPYRVFDPENLQQWLDKEYAGKMQPKKGV